MWSEVLNVKPKADQADLNKMHTQLSKRFSDVAKKFGSGLKNAVLGGGLIGLAGGIINKILNPLKDTEQVLDKMLAQADDISTAAKQFETTSGNLAKLQAFGVAAGLDTGDLNTMLGKFQVALAEARQEQNDTTKKPEEKLQFNLLKDFVDTKDTAEAFFAFIQGLQKVDKDTQVLAQKQVFGEKQILKQSDFLNQDFAELTKALGGVSTTRLTNANEKTAAIKDTVDLNTAKRFQDDIIGKSNAINPNVAQQIDISERQRMARENQNLASFESLKAAQIAAESIERKLEEMFNLASQALPPLVALIEQTAKKVEEFTNSQSVIGNAMQKLSESRAARGVVPGSKGNAFSLK